jgi:hypothetical protein
MLVTSAPHRRVTYDSGVRDWYDYDLDNSQAWRQMEARFDSWGREEYSVVFMDDGGRRYHYADNQGLLPWSRREYAYDADLELRYALELRDDGTWHPIS